MFKYCTCLHLSFALVKACVHIEVLMLCVYFRELVQSVEENASLKKHITELTNKNQQQVCVSGHSFSLLWFAICMTMFWWPSGSLFVSDVTACVCAERWDQCSTADCVFIQHDNQQPQSEDRSGQSENAMHWSRSRNLLLTVKRAVRS